MKPINNTDGECERASKLLSEYIDGTLPAGQAWEVEKHVASCGNCADVAHQLRVTVDLLHVTNRYEVPDDFMAKLHARLDEVEPAPAPVAVRLEEAWHAALESLRARKAPVLGLGMASIGLAFVLNFALNRPVAAPQPEATALAVVQPLQRNVALAAENPFEDPLAANLEAHTALNHDTLPAADTDLD